jgi:hypothetical protein
MMSDSWFAALIPSTGGRRDSTSASITTSASIVSILKIKRVVCIFINAKFNCFKFILSNSFLPLVNGQELLKEPANLASPIHQMNLQNPMPLLPLSIKASHLAFIPSYYI